MILERPDHHVKIVATIEGRTLGEAVADVPRVDLAAAHVGKGDHGFVLRLAPPLLLSELDKVNVAACCDGGAVPKSFQRLRMKPTERPVRQKPAAPPWPRDDSQFPVFILGTTRSGTSAVSRALVKSGKYAGGGEGHYLELLGALLATVDGYYEKRKSAFRPEAGNTLKTIGKLYFPNKIEQIFTDLTSSMFPAQYWVDNTSSIGMVEMSPMLLRLWPNAKFIFMKRRGIENVEFKGRKFNHAFASRCSEWANVMSKWLTVREKLDAAAIEIDQVDMALDPTATANIIAQHLALPKACSNGVNEALTNDRPEWTTEVFPSILSFADLSWNAEEKDQFLKICGPTMENYGYTYDRKYRKNNPLRDSATVKSAEG